MGMTIELLMTPLTDVFTPDKADNGLQPTVSLAVVFFEGRPGVGGQVTRFDV